MTFTLRQACIRLLFAAVCAGASAGAMAADQYSGIIAKFARIQFLPGPDVGGRSGQTALITQGGALVTVQGRKGTCTISTIILVPKPGYEKMLYASVMLAAASNKDIEIVGDCDPVNMWIIANDVHFKYQ